MQEAAGQTWRDQRTARPGKVRAIIEGALDRYVGSTQVHLIGDQALGQLSGMAARERRGTQQA